MLDSICPEIKRNAVTETAWVDEHADYLFRFAFSRLHDAAAAEDIVQETFLAAFNSHRNHRSTERTWLTAILKHKIYDHFRRIFREKSFENEDSEDFSFNKTGNWGKKGFWSSGNYSDPFEILQEKEFRAVLQNSLSELPARFACVFTLREIEGLKTEEICRLLEISPNNFRVILHRARLLLRTKLRENL